MPTGFQYGTSDTDLLHTGNTGRTTYANAAFDIINISDLTPYQQQYSYAYSDTQVLVITNTTIQQLNDMWGIWGPYLGQLQGQLENKRNIIVLYLNTWSVECFVC